MKKVIVASALAITIWACGGGGGSESTEKKEAPKSMIEDKEAYDAQKGLGKYTEVAIDSVLNKNLAANGQKSYDIKCASCHKLSDERLVGPGWKGVTSRRTPVWIMNFMTNVDEMIDKDPEVQAMLEICLVRMPNQNISDAEARDLFEFMRSNDGVK